MLLIAHQLGHKVNSPSAPATRLSTLTLLGVG